MTGAKITQPSMDEAMQDRPWIDTQRLEVRAMQLFMIKEITVDEYKALLKQIWSPDYENHVVAQEVIINKVRSI